jgi:cephalosporin hydroxylase
LTTYSRKNVALYRAATAVVTVLAVAAFQLAISSLAEADEDAKPRIPPAQADLKPVDLSDPKDRAKVHKRLRHIVESEGYISSKEAREEIFKLFWKLRMWKNMYWFGIPVMKSPSDMWMMQQLIAEVRPDYIIEAGTALGGSALYYAHMLDGLGVDGAKVITIDIVDRVAEASEHRLWKQRVEFVHGSSTDPEIVSTIAKRVNGKRVMVLLDSNHAQSHVAAELRAYSHLVSPGSYIVVEDTSLDGIPLVENMVVPGPMAATKEFLESEAGADFKPDIARESFLFTFHPTGWLRRLR